MHFSPKEMQHSHINKKKYCLPSLASTPWRQSKSGYKMKNKIEVYNSHTYRQQTQLSP